MKLYNTLTRQVDELKPLVPGKIGLYTCGPTVYDYPHVGNYSGYVYWDVLFRLLRAEGQDVNWVMNITDVGHLSSDADEGEDKLQKGAKREGKTAWQIADFYTQDFIEGLDRLNISIPRDHLVKATDHIAEQIELVQKLESQGYAYKTDDGVYFDSSKFADYGQMARLDLEGQQAGARIAQGTKKHPFDFALWKFSPPGSKRDMEWDSSWGKGFPGWHLECSAMAMKYLGQTIDIHAGGIDHIPIHHTNEIAQSQAATGKPFVNYWLHNNHMMINESKIAKSEGNGTNLHNVIGKGYDPMAFRLFVLQSHYRTQSNFTWDLLTAAANRLHDLQAMADLRFQPASPDGVEQSEFQAEVKKLSGHLDNDLNTPQALADLSVFAKQIDDRGFAEVDDLKQFVTQLDNLLGLRLGLAQDIHAEQKQLIAKRQAAREAKDWQLADDLRVQLEEQKLTVKDTDHGPVWSRL